AGVRGDAVPDDRGDPRRPDRHGHVAPSRRESPAPPPPAVGSQSGMRVGVVVLPDRPWPEARRDWELAESLGCDHVWTLDHLTMTAHSAARWHAAMPTLAAAALATHRVRIGVLVATPNLHHPVTLAHELVTLDDLSGGRFVAGLGSGGGGPDATATRAE